MNSKKSLIAALCLTLFCVLAMSSIVMAGEYGQATKLIFNKPVEVPGQVLAAGTYWFTLMATDADPDIVQIWNEDRSQLVATIFTVADYRYQPTGKTVITFGERPGDQPVAIEAWFYPGENFGHEFVYPKTRAAALAQETHKPVLSMPDEAAAQTVPSPRTGMKAVTESGEEIEVSEVIASEPQHDVVLASTPKTASLLPLWALLGSVALGASLFFRRVARNTA
jgi:hypothetical protein